VAGDKHGEDPREEEEGRALLRFEHGGGFAPGVINTGDPDRLTRHPPPMNPVPEPFVEEVEDSGIEVAYHDETEGNIHPARKEVNGTGNIFLLPRGIEIPLRAAKSAMTTMTR
jgi:hypothetical protein